MPESPLRQVNIMLPADVRERLRTFADAHGVDMASLVEAWASTLDPEDRSRSTAELVDRARQAMIRRKPKRPG